MNDTNDAETTKMTSITINNKLDVLLAEYNSLRTESLSGIDNRYKIITFTFGALSVLLAGILARKVPDMLAGTLSLFVVPQIAKASLLMWLGEYNRSMRAGNAITKIESKINKMLGTKLLQWETGLTSKDNHMGYPYIATIVFVLGGGYVATILGIYLIAFADMSMLNLAPILIIWTLFSEIFFMLFFCKKWVGARNQS
jgi:hypothetical protein